MLLSTRHLNLDSIGAPFVNFAILHCCFLPSPYSYIADGFVVPDMQVRLRDAQKELER